MSEFVRIRPRGGARVFSEAGEPVPAAGIVVARSAYQASTWWARRERDDEIVVSEERSPGSAPAPASKAD